MVYILFYMAIVPGPAASPFQYEFKDKVQCEKTLLNMKKHIGTHGFGFCQQVRK